MSLELTKEDLIEAAARGFERVLSRPENQAMIAEATATAIAQRFELLEPEAAAALLGKAEVTLRRNHVEWGLDMSLAFGREGNVFFLSQVIERAKAKVIRGRKGADKVTEFPTTKHQQKAS